MTTVIPITGTPRTAALAGGAAAVIPAATAMAVATLAEAVIRIAAAGPNGLAAAVITTSKMSSSTIGQDTTIKATYTITTKAATQVVAPIWTTTKAIVTMAEVLLIAQCGQRSS